VSSDNLEVVSKMDYIVIPLKVHIAPVMRSKIYRATQLASEEQLFEQNGGTYPITETQPPKKIG